MDTLANEIHKPTYKPKEYRKVISYFPNDLWSADLVDMQSLEKQNNGYKYILTVIDIYSRYAWAIKLKTKTGKETSEAFQSIIKQTGKKPINLWVDQGKEFFNIHVKKVLNGVNLYSTYGIAKAAYIERFNRTLKGIMYKLFTIKQNRRWIDILENIITQYNNKKHSSTGLKPKELYSEKTKIPNEVEILPDKKPKFLVNDRVRISYKRRETFDKAYLPNWTYEIFTISEIKQSNPWTYKIKDWQNEEIEGSFYESELQKTKQKKDVYLVEKILQKKTVKGKKMVLVKWLGYTEPTWQPEENVKGFNIMK